MSNKITDHVERALDRLPQQHRDKPNIEALITVMCNEVQKAEDALHPLIASRSLDEATGFLLDQLGKIVTQPRLGQDDETYRLYLKARIAVLKSSGTIEDVLRPLALLYPAAALKLVQHYPATISMTVDDAEISESVAEVLSEFLSNSVMAGVGTYLTTSDAASEDDVLYTASGDFLIGSHVAGSGNLVLRGTSLFPASGSVVIDAGTPAEETVQYISKTNATLNLIGLTQNAHDQYASVSDAYSVGDGLGDYNDPNVGGLLANVDRR